MNIRYTGAVLCTDYRNGCYCTRVVPYTVHCTPWGGFIVYNNNAFCTVRDEKCENCRDLTNVTVKLVYAYCPVIDFDGPN